MPKNNKLSEKFKAQEYYKKIWWTVLQSPHSSGSDGGKKSGFNRNELHTATVSFHILTETRKQHHFVAETTHVQ